MLSSFNPVRGITSRACKVVSRDLIRGCYYRLFKELELESRGCILGHLKA